MNLIYLLLRSSWSTVAIAVLTGLVSGGCSAWLIALINRGLTADVNSHIAGYFLALAIVALLTGFISQVMLIRLAQSAVYDLRLRLSQRVLSAPLQHLEELGASRLLVTLTEDVQTLSNTVFLIPFLCIDMAIIVGCLVYLSLLSGVVFLVVVAMMVLASLSVQLLLNKARSFLAQAREEEDRLYRHFRTITDGIKELKLHAPRRQAFFAEELQASARTSRNQNVSAMTTFAITTGWGQILLFSVVGLLLFGLPQLLPVTAPVLSAYILTIIYLMVPFQNLFERLPAFFRASVALEKVERMGLALASQTEISTGMTAPSYDWQSLELEQVAHVYRGEENHFVLGPLDLRFQPGELVFIVGGNGSGKSTLAKLITGLYIPESGKVRLDGKLITGKNREWYRQHFSAIFSDFYLFERLLGMGSPDLDRQAEGYLRQLHLEHKVQVQDGALSTTALSQGQRKRLALLTAYLEDRSIYLFDEWASDQDPLFRDIFYHQLLLDLKQRGKAILVISHDDRYFHLADRVIKLDYGKVQYDKTYHSG